MLMFAAMGRIVAHDLQRDEDVVDGASCQWHMLIS